MTLPSLTSLSRCTKSPGRMINAVFRLQPGSLEYCLASVIASYCAKDFRICWEWNLKLSLLYLPFPFLSDFFALSDLPPPFSFLSYSVCFSFSCPFSFSLFTLLILPPLSFSFCGALGGFCGNRVQTQFPALHLCRSSHSFRLSPPSPRRFYILSFLLI